MSFYSCLLIVQFSQFIPFMPFKQTNFNDMTEQNNRNNYVYCEHYKKLIVEEFSLNEKKETLHYGKCAIIGWCTFDRGLYFLGNIRITSLNLWEFVQRKKRSVAKIIPIFSISDLQLRDNAHKVLLLTNLCTTAPPIDRYVEVFGESVLCDTRLEFTDDVSSIPCTTSLDLFRMRYAANNTQDKH